MTQTAKIFTNGRSQAVRLQAADHLDTKEVFIRQDTKTGDVVLSRRPATRDGFFAALEGVDGPAGLVGTKERNRRATWPGATRSPTSPINTHPSCYAIYSFRWV